ncbi:MAG: fatty acid desaturase, partial [Acidimicrobiaceae bacterium]|nr:fatty acid desaturase [Acidimicrobiaceae bacterium]
MSIDTARPDLTAASTANQADTVPTKSEVHAALPPAVFEANTARSLRYAALSVLLTVLPGVLAWNFLPLTWSWTPVWLLYVLVAGTCTTGVWVIAHECGHGAFSKNKLVQDAVGFLFHSALLVPYFAWQRSHAVHHAKTNYLSQGETHVPKRADRESGQ